jgi:hypothetical protein
MRIGDGEVPPVDSAEVTVRLELTRRSDSAPMAENRYTYRRTGDGSYERRWA